MPSLSSVRTRSTCCLLVSGFLTESTQQIHSFRASGVISSHFARATASEMRTFRKSAGTRCTAPAEIAFLLTNFILHRLVPRPAFLSRARQCTLQQCVAHGTFKIHSCFTVRDRRSM